MFVVLRLEETTDKSIITQFFFSPLFIQAWINDLVVCWNGQEITVWSIFRVKKFNFSIIEAQRLAVYVWIEIKMYSRWDGYASLTLNNILASNGVTLPANCCLSLFIFNLNSRFKAFNNNSFCRGAESIYFCYGQMNC